MDEGSLSVRTKKELEVLLSRSELELVWLDNMQESLDATKNKKALEHYKAQYFKELKYAENIKKYLAKLS
jgi:hypothetical protein